MDDVRIAAMSNLSLSNPTLNRSLLERVSVAVAPRADARVATVVKVVVGVALLTLLAQVRILIGPVPITGQTLGVLLLGAAYGLPLGLVSVGSYLVLGAVGLPVFAGSASGLAYLAELQQPRGSWPREPLRRMPSDMFASAFIMLQLGDRPQFREAVRFDDALAWFADSENLRHSDAEARRLWTHAAVRCRARGHQPVPALFANRSAA